MCTVSIIPTAAGLRMACNRDELRTRPSALPPRVVRFGRRLAVLPLDPAAGGTWVAANDAGLAFALLNVNRPGARHVGRLTRGMVIPSLLGCDSVEAATALALRLDASDFSPFRLVVADPRGCVAVVWDGSRRELELSAVTRPLLFTSSGLGDALVEEPRRSLFEEMVLADATPENLDCFHHHRWPDRPHLGVNMSRDDARTVSYTVIQVDRERVRLAYHGGAPGEVATASTVELMIRPRVAA
jgi:uncharacterized protein with NRDE domain